MQLEVEVSKKIPCFECLFWNSNMYCNPNCKKLGDWLMEITGNAQPLEDKMQRRVANRPKLISART
jgi:hypothetical protein